MVVAAAVITPPPQQVVVPPPPAIVESSVAITSASCSLTKPGTPYDAEYTFNISGTASGPIGANVNMPSLPGYVSPGNYTNTSWGDRASRWPTRGGSDPETTNWTATLVVGGNNGGISKSIDAYVFAGGAKKATDSRNVSCQ